MTTDEIIKYYIDLLIFQYRDKPRARGHIEAFVTQAVMDQLPLDVQKALDLDTAVGEQLDIIGKYVGAERSGKIFNNETVTLSDDDYRTLIKILAAKNNLGSSMYDIQTFFFDFFGTNVRVFDNLNMQMSYFLKVEFGSENLVQYLIKQESLPKPMGVQLASVVYAQEIDSFFGFRTYNLDPANNSPFNDYATYELDYPWLQYGNAEYGSQSILTEDGDTIVTEGGGDDIILE